MADFQTLTFEQKGRIAEVTLNRPDSLNALNSEVMAEVAEVFEDASQIHVGIWVIRFELE